MFSLINETFSLSLLIVTAPMFALLLRVVAVRRPDGRMSMLLGGDDWLGAPLAVPEVINHLTMRSCEA